METQINSELEKKEIKADFKEAKYATGKRKRSIARALIQFEPDLKAALKKEKLTTRDSRAVERKKYGRRKARRSFQFSKR